MSTVIDTNAFLDHENILSEYDNVILSIVVLKELDKLKFKDTIGYSARSAIRNIRKYISDPSNNHRFDTNFDASLSPDMNIIMTAKRNDALLVTKDISMSILAESFNVECELKQDDNFESYDPYIIDLTPTFPFETIDLEGDQLKDFKKYIKEKFDKELTPWSFYLTKKDIFSYNPKKNMLECISKNKDCCKLLVDDGVTFKPKDKYQKAAIYSILNADATLITGKWGTGKSILSLSTALSIADNRKVFILRPTITSKKYDVGFLPGDKRSKLEDFFSGFISAFSSLYGNTRTTKSGKAGATYDYVKEEILPEKTEFLSITELHGLSIQEGDIVIVDEVQLLNIEYMSLLLSRINEGAKLIMLGDIQQTIGLLKHSESGLNKLLSLLPDKSVSVVELKEVYRNSDLCKLADKVIS